MRARGRPLLLAVLGILGLAGCSDTPTQPAGPPADFRGVIAGHDGPGTIEVLVAHPPARPAAGALPARATLRLHSGFLVQHLEGAFDPSAGSLALSGSGCTLRGTVSNGLLRGDGATSSGSNVFIALEHGDGADAVSGFIGYEQYQAGLAIRGGTIVVATAAPGDVITLTGSLSPADSSLTLPDPANPSGPPIGTGHLYPNYVAMRFDFGASNHWNWIGDPGIGYSGP